MIKNLVNKNLSLVYKKPALYVAALVFSLVFFGYHYATLTTETSLESLLFEKDPDLVFYEQFKDQFGENVSLVVGFSAPDIFAQNVLEFISEQTSALEKLKTVDKVISLSNVEHIQGSDKDFIVEQLLENFPEDWEDLERIRKNALGSSLIQGALVSADSQATLFLIFPQENLDSQAGDAKFVAQVKETFSQTREKWPEFKFHYSGSIQTRLSLTQATNKDMLIFMPLTYLLLIIFMCFILRSFWLVSLAIINVSFCLISTLACLKLIGGTMGPMTSILPPLIMALAVSDTIHIFTDFLKQDRSNPYLLKVEKTLHNLAVPCFLTSLTTAIGFLSLAISDIPPIRHFGLASAAGMMIEFYLSMTIIPLGLYFLRNKPSITNRRTAPTRMMHEKLERLADLLPKYCRPLLTGSLMLILFSFIAASNLEIETNLLEYFKKNSVTYQDARFVDEQLGGTESLEVSIRTKNPDHLLDIKTLKIIEKIEIFLKKQDIVSHVSSINDFYREMNKAFHNNDPDWHRLPDSRALAAQYLLLYDGKDIENVLDPPHQWTHVSARINVHSSKKITQLIKQLRNYIRNEINSDDIKIRLTGQALIANKLIDYIIKSQIESLVMAVVLIFIVMFRIFKSIRLGLISIIPNSLPILFNFAVMGASGIPLNSATAIIAAIAIGIAVDDTIHFIHAYQVEKNNNQPTELSIKNAITKKGSPIISTSLILTGGFCVLLVSQFNPTIQFGLLTSLIMIFALISDLIILPVILLKLDNVKKS